MTIFPPPYKIVQHRKKPLPDGTKTYELSHDGIFRWIEDSSGSAIALLWSLQHRDTIDNGNFLVHAANGHEKLMTICLELMQIATLHSLGSHAHADNQFKSLKTRHIGFFMELQKWAENARAEARRQASAKARTAPKPPPTEG